MNKSADEMGYTPEGLDKALRPWDRQEDETSLSFAMFCVYRDMGLKRGIREAWKIFAPGSTSIAGSMFNVSRRHKWVERCIAYDDWQQANKRAAQAEITSSEAFRVAENQKTFRDSEAYLADLGLTKAAEILAMPLVNDSYIEYRGDGKTVIHKATLITSSYYFAAAALMRAASDIGRRAHGIKGEGDDDGITAEQFKRLFYKHTGEVAKELPRGALPAPVDNAAVKPDIQLPRPGEATAVDPGEPGSEARPVTVEVQRFNPPRERP